MTDDLLRIETPENVAFEYEVAGIGSRFLAAAIDTAAIVFLEILVNVVVLATTAVLREEQEDIAIWVYAFMGLLSFAFFWGYYVFFEMIWNGQSLGKRALGLRVIRTDGTPVTLAESIIRNLIRMVDFLPLFYGVGVVTMFVNAQARRLGDLAAGTLVVWDRPAVSLQSLPPRPAPGEGQPVAAGWVDLPVERLRSRDLQMAEGFYYRWHRLTNRPALAQRIAAALLRQMEVPLEQVGGLPAEAIIVAVVQAAHKQRETS